MSSANDRERLHAVLERAQSEGALGARPITEVIAHALDFVTALPPDVRSVLDLGTGAGIPGLVIAWARPTVRLTLVDRRAKRIDALHRAIAQLGWDDRVTAIHADAEDLVGRPEWRAGHDAVVARGFTEPHTTLRLASQLARHQGWVVISEPPAGTPSRWEPAWYVECHVSPPERLDRVVRFHVEHGHSSPHPVPRGTIAQGLSPRGDDTPPEHPSGTLVV